MRRIKLMVLIFMFLSLAAYSISFAEDKIIAIVNNEVITSKDLNDFQNFMRMQLASEYKGKELETKVQSMKLDLLSRLIEDRLILQEAKKLKVQANKSRISGRITEMKKRYGSEIEFQNSLRQQGMTQADLETKISEQFMMYGIIEIKVRSKVTISPAEINNFYNQHKQDFVTSEEREVSVVSISSENMAKEIARSLKSFQNLSDLANKYGLSQEQMKVSKNGQLSKEVEEVIFKLNLNDISEPVKVQTNYYIFQVNNIIPPKAQTVMEARDNISSYLFTKKMQESLVKWIDELKKHSYIKIFQN